MTTQPASGRPNGNASSAVWPTSPAARTRSSGKPKTVTPTTRSPKGLRSSYNELETEKTTTLAAVAELDAAEDAEPGKPSADDIALLDALPYLRVDLAQAPEEHLRRLFEITQLTVRLHGDSDEVTIAIKLSADDLPQIANAAERTTETMPSTPNLLA